MSEDKKYQPEEILKSRMNDFLAALVADGFTDIPAYFFYKSGPKQPNTLRVFVDYLVKKIHRGA